MNKGFAFFTGGLVLTLGAVGGIEHSVDLVQLAQSTVVGICGVCFMWVGTSFMQEQNRPVDNSALW